MNPAAPLGARNLQPPRSMIILSDPKMREIRALAELGTAMSRPLCRTTLEAGLRLDLNQLVRGRFIKPGAATGPIGIKWVNCDSDEIASGAILADLRGKQEGWVRIKLGDLDQSFRAVACPRHFGGRQWFFECPRLYLRATVLWKPPGAEIFASRQLWGRSVAYASQFCDRIGRAHRGQQKIHAKLCQVGGFDPDEWEFPPKPKWMRQKTYERAEAKFDRYEAILNQGILKVAMRWGYKP
jgi:hypothetical protein